MARESTRSESMPRSFPHPRGDGPSFAEFQVGWLRFSPPAWGWPVVKIYAKIYNSVFPTRVGMARHRSSPVLASWCFPHPRGDGPASCCGSTSVTVFSPPAWGWPAIRVIGWHGNHVFPTRVGMARRRVVCWRPFPRFPHPRGDGPSS